MNKAAMKSSSDTLSVLGLKLPTDPRWANLAGQRLVDILTDHAYCEQKAASACISLIVQYPEQESLVEKLSPVVTEEWGHFRMVLKELAKRGLKLGRQRKDEYVNELMKLIRKGKPRQQLLDKLLVCALIEARSCERFKRLSEGIDDADLQHFYHELMIAEAGHYRLFLDLSKTVVPKEEAMQRWQEFLNMEAEIIRSMEVRGDRMH
ncbi:MAG: tRNA-(ms[2]io[6]A)-hydroxylase [Bacteroidia bacterium]